jgi:hypothetical protein
VLSSAPPHQLLKPRDLNDVFTLLQEADARYYLRDSGEDAVHSWGWVFGGEFVAVGPGHQVVLVVAADD